MDDTTWISGWLNSDYGSMKEQHFKLIDSFINKPINKILDIGCGLAFESRFFHKKYNSQLFLIDGDYKNNNTSQHRHSSYENEANLKYYCNLSDLDNFFKTDNISGYQLIDCENINIPNDVHFDLICSYLSCGFHYSLDAYRDLIQKHSTQETFLIFTLRKNKNHNCNIEKVLHETGKYITAKISF